MRLLPTIERIVTGHDETGKAFVTARSPQPLVHRTESIDHGVVTAGEITLILDHREVPLRPGTNHAWANRSDQPCRRLFVLVDGVCESPTATAFNRRQALDHFNPQETFIC